MRVTAAERAEMNLDRILAAVMDLATLRGLAGIDQHIPAGEAGCCLSKEQRDAVYALAYQVRLTSRAMVLLTAQEVLGGAERCQSCGRRRDNHNRRHPFVGMGGGRK